MKIEKIEYIVKESELFCELFFNELNIFWNTKLGKSIANKYDFKRIVINPLTGK